MIRVAEATKLIDENCNTQKIIQVPLLEANGCILAEPVYSLIDTPPFNQSAMDGYAFSFDNWDGKSNLLFTSEIQAGSYSTDVLKPLEAVRIYTGAPLPSGADTVIVQEKVSLNGNSIVIKDTELVKGSSVRPKGYQTKKGEVALGAGQLVTPAAISFLAGIGIDKVKVYSNPSVRIIVTGNELLQPGSKISDGKIYESNSFGLVAALNQIFISPESVHVVVDEESEIRKAISKKPYTDILIVTGGISVGDYDFVARALEKCGVKEIFHNVKQKPGKPFYFGLLNQTLVFALPGNPASVLTCFYQYIVPAISRFTKKNYFKKSRISLANDFRKKPGMTFFLKGKTSSENVSVLSNQESFMMNSFALADCIVELEEEKENFKKGDLVKILMII